MASATMTTNWREKMKTLIIALPLIALALPAAAQWYYPGTPGYVYGEHERHEWRERDRERERAEREHRHAEWCAHHPYQCR